MKWLRHRKARADREAGMVFAWRMPEQGIGRMIVSVLVTGLAAAFLVAMVRVEVRSPPRQSHRRGSVMLEARDGTGWFDRLCAENSPFPAPFDAMGFDDAAGTLAKHPAWSETGSGYVPRFRELPEILDFTRNRNAPVGHVDLPPLPPIQPVPESAEQPKILRRVPVLRADSPELAARIPVPLPALKLGAADVPPPGGHRFLIEVASSGQVVSAVPMAPAGEAEAMKGILRWLRSLRFEPDPSGNDTKKWYVVTVTFLFSTGHD